MIILTSTYLYYTGMTDKYFFCEKQDDRQVMKSLQMQNIFSKHKLAINYLGGRPKEIAQSIIFSMYNAMFQVQSKALYEEIAEVPGVLQGVHLTNRRF